MTFLLVVYLFLNDGRVVKETYPSAATTIEECVKIGHQKQRALKREFPDSTTTSLLCIREGEDV
jgi:hypothetical protein